MMSTYTQAKKLQTSQNDNTCTHFAKKERKTHTRVVMAKIEV